MKASILCLLLTLILFQGNNSTITSYHSEQAEEKLFKISLLEMQKSWDLKDNFGTAEATDKYLRIIN